MSRVGAFVRENGLTLLILAVIAIAYIALRSSPTEIGSEGEFVGSLAQGQPTLVYFYSNTWSACLLAKPVVDGIEREWPDVRLVRLSVSGGSGLDLARRYGVRGVPTLIVFDGSGQPALTQVGRLSRDGVREAISAMNSTTDK